MIRWLQPTAALFIDFGIYKSPCQQLLVLDHSLVHIVVHHDARMMDQERSAGDKQKGNYPIDLRRQGLWEIGKWCSMTSTNIGGHLTPDLKSTTWITLVSVYILPPTASEAMVASKQPWRSYDLIFKISNPEYSGIHVHIASNSLQGHVVLQRTSEVIWLQIWNQQSWLPWNPCACCL